MTYWPAYATAADGPFPVPGKVLSIRIVRLGLGRSLIYTYDGKWKIAFAGPVVSLQLLTPYVSRATTYDCVRNARVV